jgi:hypothetical protein
MKSPLSMVLSVVFVAGFIGNAFADVGGPRVGIDASPAPQSALAKRIEGSWRVALTARNCHAGMALAQGLGLNAFISGGSMIGIPSQPGAGVGVWEHVEGPHFRNLMVISNLTATGTPDGTTTVTRNIQLSEDGQEFFSNDTFIRADVNGNFIAEGCVTGQGVRMQLP